MGVRPLLPRDVRPAALVADQLRPFDDPAVPVEPEFRKVPGRIVRAVQELPGRIGNDVAGGFPARSHAAQKRERAVLADRIRRDAALPVDDAGRKHEFTVRRKSQIVHPRHRREADLFRNGILPHPVTVDSAFRLLRHCCDIKLRRHFGTPSPFQARTKRTAGTGNRPAPPLCRIPYCSRTTRRKFFLPARRTNEPSAKFSRVIFAFTSVTFTSSMLTAPP